MIASLSLLRISDLVNDLQDLTVAVTRIARAAELSRATSNQLSFAEQKGWEIVEDEYQISGLLVAGSKPVDHSHRDLDRGVSGLEFKNGTPQDDRSLVNKSDSHTEKSTAVDFETELSHPKWCGMLTAMVLRTRSSFAYHLQKTFCLLRTEHYDFGYDFVPDHPPSLGSLWSDVPIYVCSRKESCKLEEGDLHHHLCPQLLVLQWTSSRHSVPWESTFFGTSQDSSPS